MKIHYISIQSQYLAFVFLLTICFTTSKAHAQDNKNRETGEIVMSAEELESLLTKIAERRKATLKNNQLLQIPAYQMGRTATYQDPGIYQDLRNLQYKVDLLLSQANLLPRSGSSTTVNVPSQAPSLVAQPQNQGTVNNIDGGAREVLKGYQVFFANNSTVISARDKQSILDLIPLIKEKQNQLLVVLKGYASSVGNAFYNNQLSFNRADAIKRLLVEKGVSPGNIMILYHGADRTVRADEARRVEISLELIANY